jgi:hypothetical protein
MAQRSKSSGARRPRRPVRYAVIGLGHIAQAAVLPAFAHAKRNSVVAALVSDDAKKLQQLGRRYGVRRLCGYAQVDELFASGEISNHRVMSYATGQVLQRSPLQQHSQCSS